MLHSVLRITERGSRLDSIVSLEDLRNYRFQKIERPNIYPGDPTDFVYLEGPQDLVRIHGITYKALKHAYLSSGSSDKVIDELIKDIDTNLV